MDGVPTLMLRLGNERSNRIIEAVVRVAMTRTERTAEGMLFYRMYDLALRLAVVHQPLPAGSRSAGKRLPAGAGGVESAYQPD